MGMSEAGARKGVLEGGAVIGGMGSNTYIVLSTVHVNVNRLRQALRLGGGRPVYLPFG